MQLFWHKMPKAKSHSTALDKSMSSTTMVKATSLQIDGVRAQSLQLELTSIKLLKLMQKWSRALRVRDKQPSTCWEKSKRTRFRSFLTSQMPQASLISTRRKISGASCPRQTGKTRANDQLCLRYALPRDTLSQTLNLVPGLTLTKLHPVSNLTIKEAIPITPSTRSEKAPMIQSIKSLLTCHRLKTDHHQQK